MSQSNAYTRSVYLAAIRIGANVLMLAAVCLAMYQSSLHPASSLTVFCQWFFGLTIPTWFLASRLGKAIRIHYADADEGLVKLPGKKHEQIMRWKIVQRAYTPLKSAERPVS